jgi:hypothetical protein
MNIMKIVVAKHFLTEYARENSRTSKIIWLHRISTSLL